MQKYILGQITQVIFWVGIIVIIAAFLAPRDYIAIFGVVLLFLHDDKLKAWLARQAPSLAAWMDEVMK